MNDRDRFLQIARFERAGDPYEFEQWVWYETVQRWQREGLPKHAHPFRVLSLGEDRTEWLPITTWIRYDLPYSNLPRIAVYPEFDTKVVVDEEETRVVLQNDGMLHRVSKISPTLFPQYLEYPVKDRKSWEAYKQRLDPHSPERWPEGWDRIDLTRTDYDHDPRLHGRPWNERDFPLGVLGCSILGLPRLMMGIESFSYALRDDMSLIVDILDHLLYFCMEIMKRIFAAGITLDFCTLWEDICYKSGPLFSPKVMRELMVPRWRQFTDLLRSNGVEVIYVDCDGNLDEFLPLVLEGGLNGVVPFEVAAGNNIFAVRKRYGKNLIIFGGIDKRALPGGKAGIDSELERIRPMLQQGGYFPMLDHHAPPDISFENQMYYKIKLKSMRTVE